MRRTPWLRGLLLLAPLLVTLLPARAEEPVFRFVPPPQCAFTERITVRIEGNLGKEKGSGTITLTTRQAWTPTDDGGYLADVTIAHAEIQVRGEGAEYLPAMTCPPDMLIGMHWVAVYGTDRRAAGFQEGKSPLDWLRAHLPPERLKRMTPDERARVNEETAGLAASSNVIGILIGHPTKTGTRWFAMHQQNDPPLYLQYKVAKREKVGKIACLRIEATGDMRTVSLAKRVRVPALDIINATQPQAPVDPQTRSTLRGWWRVDPATGLCHGSSVTTTVLVTIPDPEEETTHRLTLDATVTSAVTYD